MSRHSPLVARRPFLAFIGGLILAFLALAEDVPPPSETPCEVIVSGRTSILKSIVIKKVGQNIPKIYHGEFTCKNAPGFDWYVSQHYALRANVGDKLAEQFLTLAELAYPQYVEVIGREPYDIETTRLPFVHATNLDLMQKVIVGDIGQPCIGPGGGVTMPHSCCAYNYPSGGLAYHRNDLSIHEGLHLQKFVTQGIGPMPQRFTEGTTHCFANHVYDPEKQQLTVCVFDKAPVNNPVDAGLRKMREKGILNIEDIIREKLAGEWYASAITLYTAFSWSDPERLMKWRIWRDELFRARVSGEALSTLDMDIMLKLHGGSLDGLNQQWQTWLKERQNTFTHVDWGWEQWGDTLQTYGWPWDKKYFSQMDINCVLNRKLAPDPLRLDYPRAPKSPLVGALALGVDEPSIGCVVDFKRAKDEGWAGLGLDVQGRNLLRVVVEKNKTLVLDGTLLKLQAGRKDVPFPPELLAEAKATGGAGFRIGRVGLTVRVAKAALEVTVRAGRPGRLPDEAEPFQEMTASYPLTPDERAALVSRHFALLSRDARHEIIPYIDDQPPPAPDLSKPAPANRWRFAGDKETYRLYRAAWKLGDKAPPSLVALRNKMVAAMDKDPAAQQEALTAYQDQLPKVLQDVRAAALPEAKTALVELSGASLSLRLESDPATGKPELAALLTGAQDSGVTGTLSFAATPEAALGAPVAPEQISIAAATTSAVRRTLNPAAGVNGVFSITAKADLTWRNAPLSLADTRAGRPSIPCYWVIGPFDNKGGGTVDTPQPVETDPFQADTTYKGKGGKEVRWAKVLRPDTLAVDREHIVPLWDMYRAENASAYVLVWVVAPSRVDAELAVGSDDGVVAWLNDQRIHANLVSRGYQSREDRAAVSLKAGANKLLFRITQGGGEWKMAAHILDRNGAPLPELKYSLEPPAEKP